MTPTEITQGLRKVQEALYWTNWFFEQTEVKKLRAKAWKDPDDIANRTSVALALLPQIIAASEAGKLGVDAFAAFRQDVADYIEVCNGSPADPERIPVDPDYIDHLAQIHLRTPPTSPSSPQADWTCPDCCVQPCKCKVYPQGNQPEEIGEEEAGKAVPEGLVELTAKALAKHTADNAGTHGLTDPQKWRDEYVESRWENYCGEALAALAVAIPAIEGPLREDIERLTNEALAGWKVADTLEVALDRLRGTLLAISQSKSLEGARQIAKGVLA